MKAGEAFEEGRPLPRSAVDALADLNVRDAEIERLWRLLSEAESWFEEIQHAGYAVPRGRESQFAAFWETLQDAEARRAD